MKQTLKLSAPMVLLLASMTMMGEESSIPLGKNQNKNIHAATTATLEVDDHFKKASKDKGAEPVFVERGERMYVSLENPTQSAISIQVRDGMDRLVYSETISGTKEVLKSFNFKNAFKGFYIIKVDNGSNTFSKEIEIH